MALSISSRILCKASATIANSISGVRRIFGIVVPVMAFAFLAGCQRDTEETLRSELGQSFYLGETTFFISQANCTGAVFETSLGRARDGVLVYDDIGSIENARVLEQFTALQVEGRTPAELAELSRLEGARTFGNRALAAGSLSRSCFEDDAVTETLFKALNQVGAMLAYDPQHLGLMILDPNQNKLFFVAGDEW